MSWKSHAMFLSVNTANLTASLYWVGYYVNATTGNHWFKAHGLTNSDWTALN